MLSLYLFKEKLWKKRVIIIFLIFSILFLNFIQFFPIIGDLVHPILVKADNPTLILQVGSDKMFIGDYTVDLHTATEVSDGFTYIPITAIAKGFGASIKWFPSTGGITITSNDFQIGLALDLDTAVVNGNLLLIQKVYLKNGIPMVPLKIFTDGLGASLNWDPVTQVITMSSKYVSFNPNTRWITVLFPEDGLIEPSGIIAVSNGESLTFTIVANEISKIKDVKVDGVSVGAVTKYTFSNITKDHTIGAEFFVQSFTINASAGPGGTITPSGVITVTDTTFLNFLIITDEGYLIKDVKVDNISVGAVPNYTFKNISSDHTIYAEFKKEVSYVIIGLTIGSKIASVNGTSYTLDVPATIIENRTYVPLRFIAEQLGCDVEFRDSDKKITLINGENKIELWIGKNTASVNGKLVPIDSTNSKVVPLIQNGRTLVPIRFISESLNFYVDYNSSKKLVTISNTPIVNLDGAIGYFEKTVNYNGKSYTFKVAKIDPKVKGVKFVPSLSVNGFNKGADYKTFLLPNTLVMVNGVPFDTNTFEVFGTIFGNSNGKIVQGFPETFIIDQNGNCSYEEGVIEVTANVISKTGASDALTTYSINVTSTHGGFTVYTNWYKDNVTVNFGEDFVVINSGGSIVSKVDGPATIKPSEVLKNGQFGIYAYQHSTANWIKDTVSIFGNAAYVNLKIMINGRDITNSFFVQSSPIVVKGGAPFNGAARYPDSYRMTKSGARVFIATDGRYVYFIVTPTAISLRNDPVGDIILKLGYFKYVLSLDGGGSTAFYYKDKFIYIPGRNLVTCVSVVNGIP